MDGSENLKSLRHCWRKWFHKDVFVGIGASKDCLKCLQIGLIVVSVDLLHGFKLVSEDAPFAIHAVVLLVKCTTVFALKLAIVAQYGRLSELVLTVSVSAFIFEEAPALVQPIFAEFAFESFSTRAGGSDVPREVLRMRVRLLCVLRR